MNWLHIAVKDLKIISREKIAWLTMILLPLVVVTVAGFALSGLFRENVPDLKLAYSYSGNAANIEPLIHGLEEIEAIQLVQAGSKENGLELIEKSSVTALIVIPEDFDVENINSRHTVEFYYDISSQSSSSILQGMVQGVVNSLNNSLVTIELLARQAGRYGADTQELLPQIVETVRNSFHDTDRIGIDIQGVGGEKSNESFYQVIPGFAVMFLLFSIIGGATKLFDERQNKTLRRILIAPVKKSDVIIGKWVGMTTEGFFQAVILFLVGKLIFGLSLGENPFRLLLFLLVAAGTAGAIGVFVASISKSLKQANGLAMLLFMVMSALGGSWWPLEITPAFMQTAGKFTFNYWAISGIKKLILFNQPLLSVGFEMAILVFAGLIFLFLSFENFKFE